MIHQDLDTPALKLVNHQRVLKKEVKKVRILNTLITIVIRKGILLMFAGIEGSISKAYPKARVIVTSAICKDIRLKIAGLMS